MPATKRPGRKRGAHFIEMRQTVRALKPTHTYAQIGKLLGIHRQAAWRYGHADLNEQGKICRCCHQSIRKKNKTQPQTKS